jgi:CDP-diacylglycerol---glycerol-3-phosphate 3-phosphatidyltransferase
MDPMDISPDKQNFAPPPEAGGSAAGADAHAAGAGPRPDLWARLLSSANHPNGLTLIRVACIPLIIALFSFPSSPALCFMAALLFGFAAFTDCLDGFLARRQGKVTFLGKAMDPVADKLLTSSAFIMLAAHGWAPAWVVCVIIGRELAVTGLRSVIAGKGVDISASRLGKLKTGFQIAAIIPLMIHYPLLGVDFDSMGRLLLWAALLFTMWSGTDYFLKFKRVV